MSDANPYRTPDVVGDSTSGGVGNSVIRVYRTKSWNDRFRAYRIIVDGEERGRINAGCSIDIPVEAGTHIVVAKIDWCGSPIVMVTTQQGAVTTLECASNLQGFRLLLAMPLVFSQPNDYLTLTLVD